MRPSAFILTLAMIPSVSSAADVVPKFNIAANCKAEVSGGSVTGETLEFLHQRRTAGERPVGPAVGAVCASRQDNVYSRKH